MPYVSGFDRDQLMCCSWDTFVDKESIAIKMPVNIVQIVISVTKEKGNGKR